MLVVQGARSRYEFRGLDRQLDPMSVGVVCDASRAPDRSVAVVSTRDVALA